ncbi:Macrophage infectivity potentiator-related protein [Pseudonocardia sp. Ae356_Ps1]|nr:Macrophage infectivity potentiator-related protein [Pseudonocardia sp. Ae356_Ps1]
MVSGIIWRPGAAAVVAVRTVSEAGQSRGGLTGVQLAQQYPGRPGHGVRDDRAVYAEVRREQPGGQHLGRCAQCRDAARGQHGDQVGVLGGVVEGVQRGDDGDPEVPGQPQDSELVTGVEVVGGLIEHQDPGLLGQRTGEEHPLAFPAGQLRQRTGGERGTAGALQRVGDDGGVAGAGTPERAQVRGATEHHGLPRGEVEPAGVVLGEHPDRAGVVAVRHRGQIVVAEQQMPAHWLEHPVEALEQGGLARSVGPDEGEHRAVGDGQGGVVHDRVPAVADADAVDDEPGAHTPTAPVALRRSTYRKKGTPIAAVRMPIGSSVGASTRRAAVSDQTTTSAPSSTHTGRVRRWSAPNSSRARFGTTSPTNPMLPDTATTAPVSSPVRTNSAARSRVGSVPRAEAASSPSTSRLTRFACHHSGTSSTPTTAADSPSRSQRAPARLPSIQNRTCCWASVLRVRSSRNEVTPPSSCPTATPASTIRVACSRPRTRDRTKTPTPVSTAPANAAAGRVNSPAVAVPIVVMTRTAPTEAPDDSPRM